MLGAIAAVALGVTAYFTLSKGNGDLVAAPVDQAYICLSDQNVFTLSTPQIIEAEKAARAAAGEDGMRGPPPKLKCPKCGQFAAIVAVKCPKDGSTFPQLDKSGQPGKCPKCGIASNEVFANQ